MFWINYVLRFRIIRGNLLVDYKLLSRDHKKSIVVEGAVADPKLPVTVAPLSWLEKLRSPSLRLPTGYYIEKKVACAPRYDSLCRLSFPSVHGWACAGNLFPFRLGVRPEESQQALESEVGDSDKMKVEGIIAGPLVMYITGQSVPIIVNPLFVSERTWNFRLQRFSASCGSCSRRSEEADEEVDLRLGLDAIEQCTLFAELRPGGLLYGKLARHGEDTVKCTESAHSVFRRYGMTCGLSESPLNRRPWTRMKYMFIDELQRGPKLTEFVGYNPRCGTPWRFSQHNKYFRQGIWREIVRRNEMNPGLHTHSSWQKSHQQSVPEVPFLAPFP